MSTITEITSEADFNNHLSSIPPTTLVIISFHTPWAAPCAQMATVLRTLAASYPANDLPTTSWLSLNAEELPEISDAYDVTAVPFLVLLRNKSVLETVSGSDATKVRSAIEKHASPSTTKPKNIADQLPPLQKVALKQSNGTVTKDLSSYTPSKDDAATAPQFSYEEIAGQKEDLHKRLSDLVKAAPVMLFMKGTPSSPQCGFSRQLVALLRENGVRYGFFNILADDEIRQGLKEFADWPTFPQLWVDGELVGGLDIVSFPGLNFRDRAKLAHRSRRSWQMIQTF
jgi:Grx4 family monothiol glutaredoxin